MHSDKKQNFGQWYTHDSTFFNEINIMPESHVD